MSLVTGENKARRVVPALKEKMACMEKKATEASRALRETREIEVLKVARGIQALLDPKAVMAHLEK